MKRAFFLLLFILKFAFSYSQIDSVFEANESVWRKNMIILLQKNHDPKDLNQLLIKLEQSALHSSISLKELLLNIQELEKEIENYPNSFEYTYRINFTISVLEMYAGRPERFFAINNATKAQLRKFKMFKELFQLNNMICQFLPSVNFSNQALVHYYENEQLIRDLKAAGVKDFKDFGLVAFTNAFAYYFENENEIDSAEKYYRIGLESAREYNDSTWVGIVSGNLGSILVKKGDYKKAEELLLVDKIQSIRSKQITSAINALILLTDIQISQKEILKAETYLNEADSLLKRIKLNEEELNTFYDVEMAYRKGKLAILKGEDSKAFQYFEYSYKKMKSLNRGKFLKMISLHNRRFSFEEYVHKVAELEERSRKRQYFIWLSVLLLFSFAIILFIQRRFNKRLKEKNSLIQKQSEHLETLNEQKLKLFSIVAHDMRNPYANLRNLLDLHSDQALSNEEFIAFCRKINLSIHGLNETFENIMSWAKLSMQQGIQIESQLIHFNELYKEIFEQLEANLSLKNISINYTETSSKPFYADKNLLVVVLRNLIQNAIKFSPKSSTIFVSCSIDTLAKSVQIEVKDRGIGMSKQRVDELFEKGSISSIRGTEGEKGGGLGLMITKEFIEAMKGSLELSSTPGEGSSFKMNLPYVEPKNT